MIVVGKGWGSGSSSKPDPNTLVLFHFDGGWKDDSLYNRSATVSTNVSIVDGGRFNQAMRSHADGGVLIPHTSDLDFKGADFTVEAWVKPSSVSAYRGVAGKRDNMMTAGSWSFGLSDSRLYIALSQNGSSFSNVFTGGSIVVGVWSFIAFVRSGNKIYGFINGTKVIDETISVVLNSNSYPVCVGNFYQIFSNEGFLGDIDEFRISNIARYTSNFNVPTKPFK